MLSERFSLRGKVAVITGGAGLMGRQHAEAVIEAGGVPVIADINAKGADEIAEELKKRYAAEAIGCFVDVTDKKSVRQMTEALTERFGHIDILINNAAIDPKVQETDGEEQWSRFENLPEEIWDKELAVGLKGAFFCSQVFGASMAANKGGVILNISSDLGLIAPDQRIYSKEGVCPEMQQVKPVTYSVIKHGLLGLTRYLSTYWADRGVRANALCPGGVYNDQPQDFVKRLTALIPLGRMANVDEYKAAVVFLVSDASSYINGSFLAADGGRTCW